MKYWILNQNNKKMVLVTSIEQLGSEECLQRSFLLCCATDRGLRPGRTCGVPSASSPNWRIRPRPVWNVDKTLLAIALGRRRRRLSAFCTSVFSKCVRLVVRDAVVLAEIVTHTGTNKALTPGFVVRFSQQPFFSSP